MTDFNEFSIGDEVIFDGKAYLVIKLYSNAIGLGYRDSIVITDKSNVKKTGRNFSSRKKWYESLGEEWTKKEEVLI